MLATDVNCPTTQSADGLNLKSAMKRVKSVTFHPDRVVIELNDSTEGSKEYIGMLNVTLFTPGGIMYQQPVSEAAEYLEDSCSYVIHVPGCYSLTFHLKQQTYTWPEEVPTENQTDHSE